MDPKGMETHNEFFFYISISVREEILPLNSSENSKGGKKENVAWV